MRRCATVLVLSALAAAARGGEEAGPKLLSGPYVIALGTDEATVCFQTEKPARGAVKYAPAGSEAWKEAGAAGEAGTFHAVRLAPLEPGTEYRVTALAGGAELGALAFRTAPEKLDRFTFFVYGDTRSYPEDHARVARALRAEADRFKAHTFVLNTGDLADGGSDEFQTAEQFFVPAAPVLERLPLVVAKGNHEVSARNLFDRYFPVPEPPRLARGARDLCFDYGSVRILVMDQYTERAEFKRAEWLARRLAEAKDRWRFVAFHAPIYSSGAHGSDVRWRSLVERRLRAGRAHAVFCGHAHSYERTRPIGGVTYFITGGGGAPLRPVSRERRPQPEWSRSYLAVHHFLTVEVSPEKFLVRAHRVNADGASEAFDSVEIPKDAAWSPAGEYGEIVAGGPGDPGQYDWGRGDLAARVETLRVVFLVIGLGVLCGALLARIVQRRRRAQKRAA